MENRVYKFWSAVLCVTHWTFASLVLYDTAVSEGWLVPIHLRYSAWQSCKPECEETVRVVLPVYTNLWASEYTPGVLAGMFSIISGANHFFTAVAYHVGGWAVVLVEGDHGVGPNVIRSADWALSAALMMVVNLFLYSAPADFGLVVVYAVATAQTMVVGYCIEQRQATAVVHSIGRVEPWTLRAVPLPFWAICLLYGVSWVPLLMIFPGAAFDPSNYKRQFFNGTAVHWEQNTPPDEVIVFIVWLLLTFCTFPIALCWRLGYGRGLDKAVYRAGEYVFMVLSAAAKLPLLLLFYSGVAGRRNTTLDESTTRQRSAFDFTPFIVAIAISLALAVAIRLTTRKRAVPVTPTPSSLYRIDLLFRL